MIFRVQPWPEECEVSWGEKNCHNIKHSCGLNVVFSVYIGLIQSSHYFIKGEGCGGGVNRVSGRITDREIAEGNYCYSTIKLYILGGITHDRADHTYVCVCESECETLSVYQGH